jgi:uncharacterized protein YcfJ
VKTLFGSHKTNDAKMNFLKDADMPNLDEAPREIASNVKQSSTGLKKTHPMIIVAAVAVTIFSGVGIAMMTGILPNAQSKSDRGAAKSETSAPLTAAAAGAASAGVGTMMDVPQTSAPPAPAVSPPSDLKPLDSKTVGQPMAKADQSIAAKKPPPAPTYTQRKPTVVAAAPTSAPTPNSSSERAPASASATNNNQPTPVYAQTGSQGNAPNQPDRVVERACRSCGTVDGIYPIDKAGQGSGAGAVLGGVIGGVLGHQVGGGRGRDAATVAGAVGGAVLGNQVEKNNKTSRSYDVRVRMEDNTFSTVRFNVEPNVRIGDKVRVEDGRLVRD